MDIDLNGTNVSPSGVRALHAKSWESKPETNPKIAGKYSYLNVFIKILLVPLN